MSRVSIIIPFYNAEEHIERCAHSLFMQTIKDLEYIFVDDASMDESCTLLMNVLDHYPERKNQVVLIKNKKNLGIAASRKKGMISATGDFIISCDSDDWVDKNLYETLYNKAISTNADVIICDFLLESENNSILNTTPRISDPNRLINSFNDNYITWSVWNKLIKSEFIKKNKIYPFDNIDYGEDLGVIIRVLYHSKKVEFVDGVYYHYNIKNPNSISNSLVFDERKRQQILCVEKLNLYFGNEKNKYKKFFISYKLMVKNGYLLPQYLNYNKWRKTFPELHWDIFLIKKISIILRICYVFLSFGITSFYKFYVRMSNLKKQCQKCLL